MKKILSNTIVRLVIAVVAGIAIGLTASADIMKAVLFVRQLSGQIIFFLVPLIILGFVAPSIASLRGQVTKLLVVAFALAYASSVGAAAFSVINSQWLIDLLHVQPLDDQGTPLPQQLLQIEFPPLMSVMSALVFSVLLGLGTIWADSEPIAELLAQFQKVVVQIVSRVLVPTLPFFVAANFVVLAFQGTIGQLNIFLPVVLIVVVCHLIWLALLYAIAALYSKKNSLEILRHYGPAYLTALGTMSSAATLGVALECAGKSNMLRKDITGFAIPLFANIHLCGSVLTETFFVCVVSQLLYGYVPPVQTLLLFIFLLGIFAVGAPGVPGGTVLASLGIVVSVLGFGDEGTALLIAIFALQDSFGTACNVVGDGALTLIVDTYAKRHDDAQP